MSSGCSLTADQIDVFCDNLKKSMRDALSAGGIVDVRRDSKTEPVKDPTGAYGDMVMDHRYLGATWTIYAGLAPAPREVGGLAFDGPPSKGWEETAQFHAKNEKYYRSIVVKIGKLFGVAGRTSDDGSVQEDVLCAKVYDLVNRLKKRLRRARRVADEEMQQYRQNLEIMRRERDQLRAAVAGTSLRISQGQTVNLKADHIDLLWCDGGTVNLECPSVGTITVSGGKVGNGPAVVDLPAGTVGSAPSRYGSETEIEDRIACADKDLSPSFQEAIENASAAISNISAATMEKVNKTMIEMTGYPITGIYGQSALRHIGINMMMGIPPDVVAQVVVRNPDGTYRPCKEGETADAVAKPVADWSGKGAPSPLVALRESVEKAKAEVGDSPQLLTRPELVRAINEMPPICPYCFRKHEGNAAIVHRADCAIVLTLQADKKVGVGGQRVSVEVCPQHYSGLRGVCERCGKP